MRAFRSAMILAAITVLAGAAHAVPVSFHYERGSLTADATLEVQGGQVVAGTGTIAGGGLLGSLPLTFLAAGLAPAPLTAVPSADCNPAGAGCFDVGTFSCGCDFTANDRVFDPTRAIAVDANGIAFQAGGAALNYGFALYDAGDGTVGDILDGDAAPQPLILDTGTPGGTLAVQAVPEPAASALFATAAAALGLALHRAPLRCRARRNTRRLGRQDVP